MGLQGGYDAMDIMKEPESEKRERYREKEGEMEGIPREKRLESSEQQSEF